MPADLTVENWKSKRVALVMVLVEKYVKMFFWSFSADSLDCGAILDNHEINPWVRTTVFNYTVQEM